MKRKSIAAILIVLLSLPTLFFLIFMFGEIFGGDLSGFGHLVQAAPFLLLIFIVYQWSFGKKKH